jgi:hypothetical protein
MDSRLGAGGPSTPSKLTAPPAPAPPLLPAKLPLTTVTVAAATRRHGPPPDRESLQVRPVMLTVHCKMARAEPSRDAELVVKFRTVNPVRTTPSLRLRARALR